MLQFDSELQSMERLRRQNRLTNPCILLLSCLSFGAVARLLQLVFPQWPGPGKKLAATASMLTSSSSSTSVLSASPSSLMCRKSRFGFNNWSVPGAAAPLRLSEWPNLTKNTLVISISRNMNSCWQMAWSWSFTHPMVSPSSVVHSLDSSLDEMPG